MNRKGLSGLAVSGRIGWLVFVGALVLTTGTALGQPKGNQIQEPSGRKSTEPPTRPRGFLGQDLFLAIDRRDLKAVQALIQKGADVNSRNGLDFTPIFIAAGSFQNEVVEELLKAGASPSAKSPYGVPLTFAAGGGNTRGFNIILARGGDFNGKRADGGTVLMMAALSGSSEIVKELIRRKADVQAADTDHVTALAMAARGGHVEVGKMLLNAGAKVDRADFENQTPLMVASVYQKADFVRMLLNRGAKPNLKDSEGRTPLFLAAQYGDSAEVTEALLKGGSNQNVPDIRGRTAAQIAGARGHHRVVALLRPSLKGPKSGLRENSECSQAVRLGLVAIQKSMSTFHEMTTCVSCHHEGLGRIAMGTVKDRGFAVNRELVQMEAQVLDGMTSSLQPLHMAALHDAEMMKQLPLIEINEVTTADTWFLAGMAANRQPRTPGTSAMAEVLARQQSPEGCWTFSTPRVPMQSSNFTFTALSILALNSYGPPEDAAENMQRISRARDWLRSAPKSNSEDRALCLLGLKWASADANDLKKAAADVAADQRYDGGWSQLPNTPTDAYATGQALYALRVGGGVSVTDPVYKRGVAYLLRSQDEDGSWFVAKRATPANNFFDAGFPHGQSQYSSFNGTCWAVMALAQTTNEPKGGLRHATVNRARAR